MLYNRYINERKFNSCLFWDRKYSNRMIFKINIWNLVGNIYVRILNRSMFEKLPQTIFQTYLDFKTFIQTFIYTQLTNKQYNTFTFFYTQLTNKQKHFIYPQLINKQCNISLSPKYIIHNLHLNQHLRN